MKGNDCALIHFGNGMEIDHVVIGQLFREETHLALPTVHVGRDCHLGRLSVTDCFQTNTTDRPMAFLENEGSIDLLFLRNIRLDGEKCCGNGTVGRLYDAEAEA